MEREGLIGQMVMFKEKFWKDKRYNKSGYNNGYSQALDDIILKLAAGEF